jgi:hypothetical protein
VHRIFLTAFAFWLSGLLIAARADTFSLADGSSVAGDIIKFNDSQMTLRLTDSTYTNLMWGKLSQDAFRQLSKNPKIKPFVEPFIEIPESERHHKPEVEVKKDEDMKHLALPPKQSFFGALASSSVGLFALLLIYAANVYSGFEIAVVRNRPKGLVMGVAAVLPILGPIIFLSMPIYVDPVPVEAQVPVETATFAMPEQPLTAQEEEVQVAAASQQKAAGEIFKRGKFTFNRRFIETKFAGFFSAPRSAADENNLLIVKMAGGELIVERITRIEVNDMNVEVAVGDARQEFMVPFADIQEMQIKSKTA